VSSLCLHEIQRGAAYLSAEDPLRLVVDGPTARCYTRSTAELELRRDVRKVPQLIVNVKPSGRDVYGPVLLGVSGAVIGAVIMVVPIGEWSFIRRPEFGIWLGLVCAQTGFFAIVAWPLRAAVLELRPELGKCGLRVIQLTLLYAVLFAVPGIWAWAYMPIDWPYDHFQVRILIIVGLAGLTTLPAIVAVLAIHNGLSLRASELRPHQDELERLTFYRASLFRVLWIFGVMIGLGTVGTGALRTLAIAEKVITEADWPSTLVLAYGGYFTLVLILIYTPVLFSLLRHRQRQRDSFFRPVAPNSVSWRDINAKRDEFDQRFSLTAQGNLQSVAVFVPLVSAIVANLIES